MKYKYLGKRGIFIGKKKYYNGDIVDLKSLEGLEEKMFEEIKNEMKEMSDKKDKVKIETNFNDLKEVE